MTSIMLPTVVKESHPVMTTVLLALIACAFVWVAFWTARHEHRTRKARKHGQHPHHTGRHGNH